MFIQIFLKFPNICKNQEFINKYIKNPEVQHTHKEKGSFYPI